MDDLEEVVRGNLENAHQRILDRLRHLAEAALVVSTFEDMNLCEGHLESLLGWKLLSNSAAERTRSCANGCVPKSCVACRASVMRDSAPCDPICVCGRSCRPRALSRARSKRWRAAPCVGPMRARRRMPSRIASAPCSTAAKQREAARPLPWSGAAPCCGDPR